MKTFRLMILGAGFSRPAGLPLGPELFPEVRRVVATQYGFDNHLEHDLRYFIQYIERCEGRKLSFDEINYEDFLGFLDIEHHLGLRGKDTWSSEGNESQLMVRAAIAEVLFQRTPDRLPSMYGRFVNQLTATDWILTFNYDTLVERALQDAGIPYRLFPNRYSKVEATMSTIDSTQEEVVLLKLHGSIDWFDRAGYDERVEVAQAFPEPYDPKHPIFGRDRVVDPKPIVDGPRREDDPLKRIFRVSDLGPLLRRGFWECAPLILAPSSMKLLYSQPLKDFWWGLEEAGGLNLTVGIVGYSLPQYDAYARQALYQVIRNFQGYEPDLSFDGRAKTKLRLVDYRQDSSSLQNLKDRYRFVRWERTELWNEGFNDAAVDWLLR